MMLFPKVAESGPLRQAFSACRLRERPELYFSAALCFAAGRAGMGSRRMFFWQRSVLPPGAPGREAGGSVF